MKDLLDLPLYKILKKDEKYTYALNKRLNRFKKWKPKSCGGTGELFDSCISLTNECHKTALIIRESKNAFNKTLSETNKDALSRVFNYMEQEISKKIPIPDNDQQKTIAIDRPREIRGTAKHLILQAMHEDTLCRYHTLCRYQVLHCAFENLASGEIDENKLEQWFKEQSSKV